MDLLLIRHGEATPVGSHGVYSDHDRVLSPLGIVKSTCAATALNRLDVRINALISSPCPRALQTAEILCQNLDHTPQLRPGDLFAPSVDRNKVFQELRRNVELGTIGLCGHEPDLSGIATVLLGGGDRPGLIFHTGSIAFLHVDLAFDPPQGSLRWFLDSDQLDLVARAP